MNLYSPDTIRYIKDRYGFRFSKGLGQNFLVDPLPLQALVEGSRMGEDDLVIEIGPGIGALTKEAAAVAAHVTAVEIDESLAPVLRETLGACNNVDIVFDSILDVDIRELIETKRREFGITGNTRIIGNLPYYITTPIVTELLERDHGADSITVMTQKEVADRIKATPGGKEYGGLSIMVQYRCRIEHVIDVSRQSFYPPPKVDSAILNLIPLEESPVDLEDEEMFFRFIRAGFAQRRKTLLNSLAAGTEFDKEETRTLLESAGIDPKRRAETLSIEEFAKLANMAAERS